MYTDHAGSSNRTNGAMIINCKIHLERIRLRQSTQIFSTILLLCLCGSIIKAEETKPFLIDDFGLRTSATGQKWQEITDNVMGGISTIMLTYEKEGWDHYLRIRGHVSTKNNGGFIQCRLFFAPNEKPADFSEYTGIYIRARRALNSPAEGYYIHLRTTRNMMPWSYYYSSFPLTTEWNDIYIPFEMFEEEGMFLFSGLDTRKLKSIAIVAAKSEFMADFSITQIGLY